MVVVSVLDPSLNAYAGIVARAGKAILKHASAPHAIVDLYLVNDAFVRKFRASMKGARKKLLKPLHKDGFNVLSFPASKEFVDPPGSEKWQGEVYLNIPYIKRHNEDVLFMLIHGILHTSGYDHVKNRDRIAMEAKEKKILKALTAARIQGIRRLLP